MRFTAYRLAIAVFLAAHCGNWAWGKEPVVLRGTVPYTPPADESGVPERFRLAEHVFAFEEHPLNDVSENLTISLVTFPSGMKTPHERNNTVHCEYYRPRRSGRSPGVVVLHILGGDFPLARVFCNAMAQRGVAALFLKMPYYGPRRDPEVARRMISNDPRETVEGMTQAILDIRHATAWLAAREEIDAERLGVFGISLGGITGALALTTEPRLRDACLLLAGGDVGQIVWDSPELSEVRRFWEAQGGTREEFLETMRIIDPVTYAANLRGRRILMLNAKDDEVVPKQCTLSLWNAFGQPEIVWYEGGHYSVARHIFDALDRVPRFFQTTGVTDRTLEREKD